jgi:hypothetical protein
MAWPIECAPGAQAAIAAPVAGTNTPVSAKDRAARRRR